MEEKGTKQLLAMVAKRLTEEANQQNGIERGGSAIVIPEHMTLPDAARVIQESEKLAETVEEFHTLIRCQPNDGLVAVNRAMKRHFGRLTGQPTFSFFGKQPPQSIMVDVDYGVKEECVVGHMAIPGLDLDMWLTKEPDGIKISAECKRKYLALFRTIEEETRRELKENSIYKGKAVDDSFRFLNVNELDEDSVVYPPGTEAQLQANVWTPIVHDDFCAEQGIPAKRGVLLHGTYGTGKTLTAMVTAKRAVENGWTFINVRPGQSFRDALKVAKNYEPAVVFVEDIDAQTDGGRDSDLNSILETFDGLVTKSNKIMVVLTTNHIERINRAMLRPGRLDALIEFGSYDAEATEQFIRVQARDAQGTSLIEGELDSDALWAASSDYTPAFLAEGVKRAKIYAMARLGESADEDMVKLTSQDIEQSFLELRSQWDIMQGIQDVGTPAIDDHLGALVRDQVISVLRGEAGGHLSLHGNPHAPVPYMDTPEEPDTTTE